MPTPIASICFAEDLRLQLLQAISVDRMMDHGEVSRYLIVVNDPKEQSIRGEFKSLAQRMLSKDLFGKLEILTSSEILGDVGRDNYYDQQAIKLKLASVVESTHWLMLDAKNHIVHPVSMDIFAVGACSKVLMNVEGTKPYWERYLSRSLSAVEVDLAAVPANHLSSVTPIMLDAQIAREVVDFLESKYQSNLPAAMRKTGGTEFLLYFSWILKKRYQDRFEIGPPPFRTLFTSWPQDKEQVSRFILETGADRPFLGVHRKRLLQLLPDQKALISEKWHEFLLMPWEDSHWFLDLR